MLRQPRRRVGSVSGVDNGPHPGFAQALVHSHVSTYRSSQMEVHLYSPSVKTTTHPSNEQIRPLPVYGDHDVVTGKVILDSTCSPSGRLVISVEGAFLYSARSQEASSTPVARRKHVFFASSTCITVSPSSDTAPPSRSTFIETFNQNLRRRPSASSLNLGSSSTVLDRTYPYAFDLPRGSRPEEEMPPTFAFAKSEQNPTPEDYEIVYQVRTCWESAYKFETRQILEIPFIFQPDVGFQSLDGSSLQPQTWLEMPLRSDRPIPFSCAITLPSPVTFSRSAPIPYFVVFTTTPRSVSLAQEIAADATVSVSLLRQITITESPSLPPSPPQTPSTSSEESDAPRSKLLKRVRTTPPIFTWTSKTLEDLQNFGVKDKPLPRLPTQTTFIDSKTLSTTISIGFPKRPRQRQQLHDPHGHPSLDAMDTRTSLPDGLLKGQIQLSSQMLPFTDWAGVSIKYYLDLSVLIGNDDLRARIPIRIV